MSAEFPVHLIVSVPLLERHTKLWVIDAAALSDGRVKRTVTRHRQVCAVQWIPKTEQSAWTVERSSDFWPTAQTLSNGGGYLNQFGIDRAAARDAR